MKSPHVGQPATRGHTPSNTAFPQCFLLPPTAARIHAPSSHSSNMTGAGLSLTHNSYSTSRLLKQSLCLPTSEGQQWWLRTGTRSQQQKLLQRNTPSKGLGLNGAPVLQVGGMSSIPDGAHQGVEANWCPDPGLPRGGSLRTRAAWVSTAYVVSFFPPSRWSQRGQRNPKGELSVFSPLCLIIRVD